MKSKQRVLAAIGVSLSIAASVEAQPTSPSSQSAATSDATLHETVAWLQDYTRETVPVIADAEMTFLMNYEWYETCQLNVITLVGTKSQPSSSFDTIHVPIKAVRRIGRTADSGFSLYGDPKAPWVVVRSEKATERVLSQSPISKIDLWFTQTAGASVERIRAAVLRMAHLCGAKLEREVF